MATKHVLILWSNPLFQASVSRLLDHPDRISLEAAQFSPASLWNLQSQQPDVVIFENTDTHTTQEVVKLLASGDRNLRLIGFNLEANEVWSFQRECRSILKAEDLKEMVLR